jgi:hypothetical protein
MISAAATVAVKINGSKFGIGPITCWTRIKIGSETAAKIDPSET